MCETDDEFLFLSLLIFSRSPVTHTQQRRTISAFNLNSIMKRQLLGKEWSCKKMKAIRFHVIRLAGRVVQHTRRLIVRLARNHPSTGWLLKARDRIAELSPLPVG
jgi:hypothetical protein